MQKLIFYLSCVFCMVLVSCSNSEENYSCDAETNNWAKENLSEIRSMKRVQWKSLPTEMKKTAAFIVFTPEQKFVFWKEKLTETMSLDWTEAEKKHIKKVCDFVVSHPELFDDEMSDDLRNEMDLFFYKWTEQAKSEFNWSKETIGCIISNGNEVVMTYSTNKKRTISVKSYTGQDQGLSSLSCHCNKKYDFCGQQDSCEDANCDETSAGCGILLMSSCNGRCSAFG